MHVQEELKESGHTPELNVKPDLERRTTGARVGAPFQKVEKQEFTQDKR